MKAWTKTIIVALALSFVLGGALTSYLDFYEEELLMPLRNLIVLGQWDKHDPEELGLTRYQHGTAINPVHVAQTARPIALRLLESDEQEARQLSSEDKQTLSRVADALLEMGETYEYNGLPYAVWWYRFDYPPVGLRAPWLSGMAQGHVIEVMLATYKLTGNEEYLSMARLAGNTLQVPIEAGGVALGVKGGGVWFAEYAQPGVSPPRVLNGHNFALSGLRYLCIQDAHYCNLYERGIEGLRILLPRFDAVVWSQYDLAGTPASPQYQRLHVKQLRELATVTGEEMFSLYADKFLFQIYLPLSAFYRLAVYHNRFLVITFSLNVLGLFIVWIVIASWSQRKRRKALASP